MHRFRTKEEFVGFQMQLWGSRDASFLRLSGSKLLPFPVSSDFLWLSQVFAVSSYNLLIGSSEFDEGAL